LLLRAIKLSRHPRESGDPLSQNLSVFIADAAEYWMPAFAGMSANPNLNSSRSSAARSAPCSWFSRLDQLALLGGVPGRHPVSRKTSLHHR